MDLTKNVTDLLDQLVQWSPKLVAGILALIAGFWIANLIAKMVGKALEKSGLDKDVIPFLKSFISVLLKFMVVITAAGIVGVEITAFAALLAGAGLAIGAALSGTLGHFASGIMILIFKPYVVGDLIELQGQVGHVREIQVFNTILESLDGKKVIIPNAIATSGIMTNLTTHGKLRVDLNVAVPYDADFEKIKNIIKGALSVTPNILPDEPTIEIEKFDTNNVLMVVRPYATPEKYWNVYFDSYKNIKEALGEAGIVANPRNNF